jgi:hypothetical protein
MHSGAASLAFEIVAEEGIFHKFIALPAPRRHVEGLVSPHMRVESYGAIRGYGGHRPRSQQFVGGSDTSIEYVGIFVARCAHHSQCSDVVALQPETLRVQTVRLGISVIAL